MKKKILLIAMMIAVVACLFALCVNAQGIKADSTSIDMIISFYDADYKEISKTVKVDELFNVSYKNEDGEYYFKLTGVKSWNVEIDGTSYSIKSQLAGLYLPEGITHVPDEGDNYWGFTAATAANVRKVHLPESLQDLGGNFLRNIGHVMLVNEDGTFDNYLPESLVSVQDHLFCNWTLYNEIIYFPKGFHTIGTKTGTTWNFEGFKQVNSKITFVFLGKMTHIDFDTNARDCNPTFIFAANEASDLWGYELSMIEGSTTKASLSSYTYNNDSTKNTLSIFWATKEGINSSADKGKQTVTISDSAPSLVFCGSDKVQYSRAIRFSTNATNYPALVDGEGVALSTKGSNSYGSSTWNYFYSSPIEYDMDAHATAGVHYNSIVYQEGNCGYDETTTTTCVICKLQSVVTGEKATGNHTYTDDFNCETALDCEICKKTLEEALTHNVDTVILYESGYMADGLKTIACQNEGCQYNDGGEAVDALFECLGYSAPESGEGGIALGFTVNHKAIAEYCRVTGKTLKYGVFAASQEKLDSDDIFASNGVANASAICFEIHRTDFAAFEIKVTGFTDENKGYKLAMGAYVAVTDGEATEYSYMQDSTKGAYSGKYYFASFNDIVGTPSTDEEVTQ